MAVKIITDSTADISPEVARDLGISIVPVYVRFGDKVYRDGVDISKDELYNRLETSPVHPATSQPSPQDFAQFYTDCAKDAESIVSIHVTSKLSGTCNAALQGKEISNTKCPIEIIDSDATTVGLAIIVMAAARLAKAGKNLPAIVEEAREAVSQIRIFGIFDTVKYLVLGGRVGKATATLTSVLQIKPLFTFKNGELVKAGLARTYASGMDKLYAFAQNNTPLQDLAIAYSTVREHAHQMKTRLGSFFPAEKIYVAQLGAALGVHGGPGLLAVALRRKK
ncbi:MAG: DegV family protein [Phycisphaerales bacterium]|jgi:DegV family protein with EDD domain